MKLVRYSETKEFKNSDDCVALEYGFNDPDINISVVKINGRYPERGRVMNEKCKELGHVLEGNGFLVVEDSRVELKKDDAVLIEPGERFYWEGNLTMLMPCTPAWSPEQHKMTD